ncbi:MAG: Flp pilus assembly protein CpaB [Methylococcales bacterium]|nr:Flp pilus assembly protein CpaB [Methylococcales bacterium]
MNRRFIIMLVIALLLAFLAAWVANRWIQGKGVSGKATPVVVAAVEIPFGVKLEDAQLKVIDWPENSAPKGSFSSKDKVAGKITMNKFYPDEILTEQRISEYLGGSTLSALITKEYRAVSVPVNEVVGVSGFILPGNRVDILATKMDRATNQATTRTLLQNIKVLAVDQEASQEKEKPAIVKAVTLELKPEQAEIIVKAMQEGTIQLTLRNPLDNQLADISYKGEEIKPAPDQLKPVEKIPVKKRVRKIIPWQ